MDQFDNKPYDDAKAEIKNLGKSISPLASVLLVADLSPSEFEAAISKIPSDVLKQLDERFNLGSMSKNNYPVYCDFKEVMHILGKSKGTVEKLIIQKKIIPIQKNGSKRRFNRDDINGLL
jgi:excisionase family DNA binding protein